MGFSDYIKKRLARGREKHKLSFTNATTYHEKWSFKLSMSNLYTLLILYTIIITVGLMLLFRYTPLKEIFVNVPPPISVSQVNQNTEMIDSLSKQVKSRQMYLDDLQKILRGESFDDSLGSNSSDSIYLNYQANFSKSKEDSLLRLKVENEGKTPADFSYDFFFAPVQGVVSKSFDKSKKHYGIDIVTEREYPIKSCLDGTILFASWTPNDGEVVIIQHNNDFISIYKHCSSILIKVGDQVKRADPLGIVGNSGKHTSGTHLHFEIWQKGNPINPQELISF